jgi:hypothetical protein
MPAKYMLPKGRYTCAAAYLNTVITDELSAEAQAVPYGGGRAGSEAEQEREVYVQQCATCCGSVAVHGSSHVTAENCDVSSSCGKSSVDLYPEDYVDEDGNPNSGKFPCGGIACGAMLRLGCTDDKLYASDRALGQVTPQTTWCKVDREGEVYAREGRHRLDSMSPDENYDWTRNDGIETTEGIQAPTPRTAEPTTVEGWHSI